MARIEDLADIYAQHIATPWQRTVAGAQRDDDLFRACEAFEGRITLLLIDEHAAQIHEAFDVIRLEAECGLEGAFAHRIAVVRDATHGNAVEETPEGHILLSFRQTSTVMTVDRATGKVIWRWGPGELSHQHDPTVLENGNYLIYDNGEHRLRGSCYSRAVEMNPRTNQIEWEYRGSPPLSFFSTGISSAQRLANGNTLITESSGGRILEVTPDGETVWEFINPARGQKAGRSPARLPSVRGGLNVPADARMRTPP